MGLREILGKLAFWRSSKPEPKKIRMPTDVQVEKIKVAQALCSKEPDTMTGYLRASEYLKKSGMEEEAWGYAQIWHIRRAEQIASVETDEKAKQIAAGRYLEEHGVFEEADHCYARAGDLDSRIRIAENLGLEQTLKVLHRQKAGAICSQHENPRQMARAAGKYLEDVGMLEEAYSTYRMGLCMDDMLRVSEKLGRQIGSPNGEEE